MSSHEFARASAGRITVALAALLVGSFLEASSDWVTAKLGPTLTFSDICLETMGMLAVGLILGVPLAMLTWNWLLAPVFRISRIGYMQAMVICAALYWMNGLG